jgi:hypothetical protein
MSTCHQTGADIAHNHGAQGQRQGRAHFVESSPAVVQSPFAPGKLVAMLINVTLLLFIVMAAAVGRRRQPAPD